MSAPADEAREERARLAAIAAAAPLALLFAPAVLPFEGDRSLLASAHRDSTAVLMIGLVFGAPLFVGAFGLWRALTRRPPHGLAFGLPAALHVLGALGVIGVLGAALTKERRVLEEPAAWAALVAAALVIYLLARGFRRHGFDRWAQLVAAAWLSHAAVAGVLWLADRDTLMSPAVGGWLYVFGVVAAAPIVAWSLFARR